MIFPQINNLGTTEMHQDLIPHWFLRPPEVTESFLWIKPTKDSVLISPPPLVCYYSLFFCKHSFISFSFMPIGEHKDAENSSWEDVNTKIRLNSFGVASEVKS